MTHYVTSFTAWLPATQMLDGLDLFLIYVKIFVKWKLMLYSLN